MVQSSQVTLCHLWILCQPLSVLTVELHLYQRYPSPRMWYRYQIYLWLRLPLKTVTNHPDIKCPVMLLLPLQPQLSRHYLQALNGFISQSNTRCRTNILFLECCHVRINVMISLITIVSIHSGNHKVSFRLISRNLSPPVLRHTLFAHGFAEVSYMYIVL